jgi:hypothetical protein
MNAQNAYLKTVKRLKRFFLEVLFTTFTIDRVSVTGRSCTHRLFIVLLRMRFIARYVAAWKRLTMR